ncbi:MAG: hypothetical protein PVH91_13565 [Pseudomonadales bacterium]
MENAQAVEVLVIWIVEKKVVPHLLTEGSRMAELPLRVSFEYAVEAGAVVDGSLSFKVLYNGRSVSKEFPEIAEETLAAELEKTASDAIDEHLAFSGFDRADSPAEAEIIGVH